MTTPERSAAARLMGAACRGKPKTLTDAERMRRKIAMAAMNKARAKVNKARFVVLDKQGNRWPYEAEDAQHAVTLARHDGVDAVNATQQEKGEK